MNIILNFKICIQSTDLHLLDLKAQTFFKNDVGKMAVKVYFIKLNNTI